MSELLDRLANFPSESWVEDPDKPAEELRKELTEGYTTDPPPNISPVEAEVIEVGEPDEEGVLSIVVRMSVENFIRNSIEYGVDPYEILTDIKAATDERTAAAAFEFMKDPTNDFKVALIGPDGGDIWPTTPQL